MNPKMLKSLKTSSKISLKFTLFTIVIVFIFWVLANLIFFRMWYWTLERDEWPRWPENWFMREPNRNQERPERPEFEPQNPDEDFKEFRNRFIDRLSLTTDSEEFEDLKSNTVFMQISKLWDEYFFYDTLENNRIVVKHITPNVQAQKNLLLTSIYLLIFSAILSYIVSLYFVKTSLRKLNDLVDYVKWLNLNNLDSNFEITWPENDEINILASKINSVTDKINKQTLALKDFISNASHELRTPLMSINTEIDYSLKSKEYKEWMENIKWEILNLNNLLDELVLISKLDSDTELKKSNKNILDVVSSVSKMIEKKYKDKWLKLELKCDDVEKMVHNSSFEIIAKNLIENAFKYTDKWSIKVTLNDKEFSVKDTWKWIKKENLDKVWDRFWQEDSSKTDVTSFGLWLYLVKLLVEKHWWNIEVKSNEWKWSEFKISF